MGNVNMNSMLVGAIKDMVFIIDKQDIIVKKDMTDDLLDTINSDNVIQHFSLSRLNVQWKYWALGFSVWLIKIIKKKAETELCQAHMSLRYINSIYQPTILDTVTPNLIVETPT